jgi:hypothetical protein
VFESGDYATDFIPARPALGQAPLPEEARRDLAGALAALALLDERSRALPTPTGLSPWLFAERARLR